jgi:hypothetical protein
MTAPEQPDDLSTNPNVGVPAEPDPSIAPGTSDPDDTTDPAEPPADRWVRFEGAIVQAVTHIGEWMPGEVKHVAGWLAERLLGRADFVEAEAPEDVTPAGAPEAAPEQDAPKPRRSKPTSTDDTPVA